MKNSIFGAVWEMKSNQQISWHWPLHITPENIKKLEYFWNFHEGAMGGGIEKGSVAWNKLISFNVSRKAFKT